MSTDQRKNYKVKSIQKQKHINEIMSITTPIDSRSIAKSIAHIENSLNYLTIEEVTLSLLSPDSIVSHSIGEIDNSKDIMGFRGVNDLRMGTTEHSILCQTCTKGMQDCPGHPGHIELAIAVLHPEMTTIVIKTLQCVCFSCASLLISPDQYREYNIGKLNGFTRLNKLAQISEGLPCGRVKEGNADNIGACIENPKYTRPTGTEKNCIIMTPKGSKYEVVKSELSADSVLRIFEHISQEDAQKLGFTNGAHPVNLLITRLIVTPPRTRPNTIINGKILLNPLTQIYKEIITTNNAIRSVVPGTQDFLDLDRKKSDLAFKVRHLINNSDGSLKPAGNNSVPPKGLVQRLQGKHEHIRASGMGKRSNQSGRSVIGVDPTLKFGQIRIPSEMAKQLTRPIKVNSLNIDELNLELKNGNITHIIPRSGVYHDKRLIARKNYYLRVGDTIERTLRTGDYIMFGRQPTLHRHSVMSYEVVIVNENINVKPIMNIGLHMSSTAPHHADFDGDEGHTAVPQTEGAQLEMEYITAFKKNIISESVSAPVTGIYFDALVGLFLLTKTYKKYFDFNAALKTLSRTQSNIPKDKKYMEFTRQFITTEILDSDLVYNYLDVPNYFKRTEGSEIVLFNSIILDPSFIMNIYMNLDNPTPFPEYIDLCIKNKIHPFSGRALVSAILPRDFEYRRKLKKYDEVLIIKDGFIISGCLNDESLKDCSPNSIIHIVWQNYGDARTGQLITELTMLGEKYATTAGVSIGLIDCMISDDAKKRLNFKMSIARNEIESIEAEKYTDPLLKERKERKILDVLDGVVTAATDIANKELGPENRYKIMIASGAKGNLPAITQISVMVGQQFLNNARPVSLLPGNRVTPWSPANDTRPEAKGFCVNSFIDGLSPMEVIVHAATGRTSLVDMAIKTAGTGAAQRRMIKITEDLYICHDGTVRNGVGKIIQIAYGDDGMNPKYTSRVKSGSSSMESIFNIEQMIHDVNADCRRRKKLTI